MQPIHLYVGVVASATLPALTYAATVEHARMPAVLASSSFWVLFAILLLAELRPLRIDHRVGGGMIALGTMFAVALLHLHGILATAAALMCATVVSDCLNRLGVLRATFNAGMYALSVFTGGIVLVRLFGASSVEGGVLSLLGALAVGAVIFITQTLLTAGALAVAGDRPLLAVLRSDWRFNVSTMALMVSLAPAVVVLAEHVLWLLPILVATIGLVYLNVRRSLQHEREALHDLLTDLPNRRFLEQRANVALRAAKREGRQAAMVLLDLDGFKEVNDTFGHHIGDEVLKCVAARLTGLARGTDTVARLGGDEFAVLLADAPDIGAAVAAGERMTAAIRQPIDIEGLPLAVDASAGIALYPRDGLDAGALLVHADGAMYQSKRRGAETSSVTVMVDDSGPGRLALISELSKAVPRKELDIVWQPQVDAHGHFSTVEALLRWNHPLLGTVLPGVFMPLVEQTDLIGPVTLQVIDKALAQLRRWLDAGIDLDIAVNLSARNLHDSHFPHDVRVRFAHAGVPPERVTFEITEHCLVHDPERATVVLQELAELGVRISIDDFGTGFSSLNSLRSLPVTELKIDRSFISDITDPAGETLVVSVIRLAHGLHLDVVAEGVETTAQHQRVFALGCDRAQGYAIARPQAASDIEALIRHPHQGVLSPASRSGSAPVPAVDASW